MLHMMWRWTPIVVAIGCGSSGGPSGPIVDAAISIDAGCAGPACNVVTQAGCTNKKCSWVVDETELGHGHVGCVFAGATPTGLPCTRDAFGADTCVNGTTCHLGQCRTICDLQGGAGSCGAQLSCQATELFHMCASAQPLAGICL